MVPLIYNNNLWALAIEAVYFCGAKDTSGESGASMQSKE